MQRIREDLKNILTNKMNLTRSNQENISNRQFTESNGSLTTDKDGAELVNNRK